MRRQAAITALACGLTVASADVRAGTANPVGPAVVPRAAISFGPSLGYFGSADITAGSVTLDITAAISFFWLGVGVRTAHPDAGMHLMPYVELGGWVPLYLRPAAVISLSLGVGYTVGFTEADDEVSRVPRHNVHLYLGLPLFFTRYLIKGGGRGHGFVLVPYYRPMWGRGGGGTGWTHEAGLMIKGIWFIK